MTKRYGFSGGVNASFFQSPIVNLETGIEFGKPFSRNIYMTSNGILRTMPFDTGTDGMWYFDGQVFYQRKVKV